MVGTWETYIVWCDIRRVAACYSHIGDCLARYCHIMQEESQPTGAPEDQQQQQQRQRAILESKACAAELVNASLASNSEELTNYILDWIAANGGSTL